MQKPNRARRRILQGAALTPAIYTLHSGAATAAVSHLRCLKNRKPDDQPKELFTLIKSTKWHTWKVNPRGVHIVRKVDINSYFNEVEEEEVTEIVSSAKSEAFAIVNYGRKGHRDSEGKGYNRVNVAGHSLFTRDRNYYQVIGRRPAYTYVYVDDKGQVKGTGPTHKKHMCVTTSCWHSVRPSKA